MGGELGFVQRETSLEDAGQREGLVREPTWNLQSARTQDAPPLLPLSAGTLLRLLPGEGRSRFHSDPQTHRGDGGDAGLACRSLERPKAKCTSFSL